MTVDDYLNEPMIVGGEPTTRGQFILDMQRDGHTQRAIDAYLMGYDLMHERPEGPEGPGARP